MNCKFCNQVIVGKAIIEKDDVYHKKCYDKKVNSELGYPYKCPNCFGKGYTKKKVRKLGMIAWEGYYDEKDTYTEVEETCDLCNGRGWLEKEPKKVSLGYKYAID